MVCEEENRAALLSLQDGDIQLPVYASVVLCHVSFFSAILVPFLCTLLGLLEVPLN